MSIETLEELREKLDEAAESLDRAQREHEKIERLHAGIPDDDDDGPELVEDGIDNFTRDAEGGIWIGNERIGGPDVIDNADPHLASSNFGVSPAELQRLGLSRSRDDHGRYLPNPTAVEPLYRVPCEGCGEVIDMNKVNPLRPMWDQRTGQGFIEHDCRCGEKLITQGDELPGEVQQKAIENSEIMDIIIEHYMERPVRD